MKKYTAVSIVALTALLSFPASAFLEGDSIDIRYLFPDTDTVFATSDDLIIGDGAELACPGGGVCTVNFGNVFLNDIDIDPVADSITIDWNGGAGFTMVDGFNGFEFAQLDEAIALADVQCVRVNGGPCDPQVTFGTDATLGNYLRINYGSLGVSAGVTMTTVTVSPCAADEDTDADGVPDIADNCLLVANADQLDADGDGFGNVCDQDINNDGVVNVVDLGQLRAAFFSSPGSANWEAGADFNDDGVINVIDLGRLRASFFSAPGPGCSLGVGGLHTP